MPVHMPLFFTYRGIAPLLRLPVPEGFFTATPVDYDLGWLYFGGFLTATLTTAAVFYRYVEVPARNYLNRRCAIPRRLRFVGRLPSPENKNKYHN